jgi:hypothetical protein
MRGLTAMLGAGAIVAALGACGEITVPDHNAPSVDQLTTAPTASTVNMAATGMLIHLRGRVGLETSFLGVLGKESYILDASETQFVTVFLGGPVAPGMFAEDFGWTASYLSLRQGAIILEALEKVPFTPPQKEGIRGFVKTVMAMELFTQVRIRDQAGIVVDISAAISPPVAPIVPKDQALTGIAQLLDEAVTHLELAGGTFAFALHPGFGQFNTPATFIRFNRGIKARVEVYRAQWASALAALAQAFVDTSAGSSAVLRRGAYHVYSTAAGDTPNGMLNPAVYVHPSILAGAQARPNGQPDLRLTQKTAPGTPRTVAGVQGTHRFIIYPTNTTDVPILRNEELILLRAEARYHSGDAAGALRDINFIRVNSGGLAPLTGFANETAFVDELLYNRAYSLLFEGGHRWVDARRYGRLAQLPKINPGVGEKTFSYIMLPRAECEPRSPRPQPGCAPVPGV